MTRYLALLSDHWSDRSPREQLMVLALAIFIVLLVVQTGIVSPLRALNAAARADYQSAASLHARIQRDVQTYRDRRSDRPEANTAQRPLRTLVGMTATASGLAVNRMSPAPEARLAVEISAADEGRAMRWLVELQRQHRVQVVSATLGRTPDGQLALELVLQRSGAAE